MNKFNPQLVSNFVRQWQRKRNAQRAFSLIELLLTMTAGTTLTLLAVGVIHQSMHLFAVTEDLQNDTRRASLFARQLRQDINRASFASIKDQTLVLVQGRSSIEITYTSLENQIIRKENRGTQVLQQERYHFRPGVSVQLASWNNPLRVCAEIVRQSEIAGQPPRVDRQIVATVGRLSSWSTQETSSNEATQP